MGTNLPPLRGQSRPIETACSVLGTLLGSPDQQITRGLLLAPGVGTFVRWSLVLGALPGKMGKFHFNYVCMCLYGNACVVGIFRQRVDSMIPDVVTVILFFFRVYLCFPSLMRASRFSASSSDGSYPALSLPAALQPARVPFSILGFRVFSREEEISYIIYKYLKN